MKTKLLFTLLLTVAMAFGQGSGEVIITEIHNRPLKPTNAQVTAAMGSQPSYWTGPADATNNEGHTEWFEVYNTTGSPVVMDGWQIKDASNSSTTTIGTFTIAANSYAVFSGFKIPDAQGGIVFDYFYDYKKPSLNNESSYSTVGSANCPDGVIISKPDGVGGFDLVDEVIYDYGYGYYIDNPAPGSCNGATAATGIPASGSSSNVSFMLKVSAPLTAAGNDVAANWEFSTLTYDGTQKGTPGQANNVDATLSTNDVFTAKFKIYPNPAKNFLNIDTNNITVSSIEILDVLGKSVYSQNGLTNNKVDVSALTSGVYFLSIKAEGNTVTRKIIKD